MADILKDKATKSNPSNPRVLGIDLEDAVVSAVLGAGASEFIAQKAVGPFTQRFFKPANSSNAIAKMFDAAVTAVSGLVVRDVVGMVKPSYRDEVGRGVAVLVGAKLASIVISGFSLTPKLPDWDIFPSARPASATAVIAPSSPAPSVALGPGTLPSTVGAMNIRGIGL